MSILTLETPTPLVLELPHPRASTRVSSTKAGVGEIKPHNVQGIHNGLRDLRRHVQGKGPVDAVLLTYVFTPGAKTFRIFALRPLPGILSGANPTPNYTSANPLGWLTSLGQWYLVQDAVPPTHTDRRWIIRLGPTVRGSALEPVVRQAFIDSIRRTDTTDIPRAKWPNSAGPDVQWREVAEYLYELVGELSDGR